jgi:hypothetical protein
MYRLFAVIFAGLISIAPSFAAESTPDGTVRKFYDAYGVGSNSGKTGLDDQLVAKLFDASLARLYKRAGDTNVLEADFFVQGQDWDLVEPFKITKVVTSGKQSRVTGLLRLNDIDRKDKKVVREETFSFLLAKKPDGWRISNAFNRGQSVRQEWSHAIRDRPR